MAATAQEDKRLSECKKLEGEDGFNTVECLRARLLAERQASRVAKENAEMMGNKLVELENKLREETKLMKKAGKKLKCLNKKLESLNISPALQGSDRSSSSENCGSSCTSSSSSSDSKDPHNSESRAQNKIPEASRNSKDDISEISISSNQSHCSVPVEEISIFGDRSDISFSTTLKDSSLDSSCESTSRSQDLDDGDKSPSKFRALLETTSPRTESENEEYVDNSWALVPVNTPLTEPTKSSELKIINKTVVEALDALRRAREKIESSMQRGHMIRARPA
ncbi:hypothetical protein K2173_014485 [Erythroxylum novogranatense]|uniref:Suppressor protein SRP40 n=1 Tax=Erythroxylum novogranatense TaxID=1862640 RepID=A0AAV8S4S3_9ROSI|nr:hypothetical protein K2173_014485 [Erythroxylum novogranatense]